VLKLFTMTFFSFIKFIKSEEKFNKKSSNWFSICSLKYFYIFRYTLNTKYKYEYIHFRSPFFIFTFKDFFNVVKNSYWKMVYHL